MLTSGSNMIYAFIEGNLNILKNYSSGGPYKLWYVLNDADQGFTVWHLLMQGLSLMVVSVERTEKPADSGVVSHIARSSKRNSLCW